jgi:hypothetical protein
MRGDRTGTTSFLLEDATLKILKAREAKFAAAEAYFEKYGIPLLSPASIERIEAEWAGAASPNKKRRRTASRLQSTRAR